MSFRVESLACDCPELYTIDGYKGLFMKFSDAARLEYSNSDVTDRGASIHIVLTHLITNTRWYKVSYSSRLQLISIQDIWRSPVPAVLIDHLCVMEQRCVSLWQTNSERSAITRSQEEVVVDLVKLRDEVDNVLVKIQTTGQGIKRDRE